MNGKGAKNVSKWERDGVKLVEVRGLGLRVSNAVQSTVNLSKVSKGTCQLTCQLTCQNG